MSEIESKRLDALGDIIKAEGMTPVRYPDAIVPRWIQVSDRCQKHCHTSLERGLVANVCELLYA